MIERPSGIKIEKFSPTLGAIITGVDLSQKIRCEFNNKSSISRLPSIIFQRLIIAY